MAWVAGVNAMMTNFMRKVFFCQRGGEKRAREAAVRKVTPAFARPFHLELGLAA